MTLEQSKSEYLAMLVQIEHEYGPQAALVTQALASLQFSIEHTRELIALAQVGTEAAETSDAIWSDTRDRITHALLAPLLYGLDADRAAVVSAMVRARARYLTRRPLVDQH